MPEEGRERTLNQRVDILSNNDFSRVFVVLEAEAEHALAGHLDRMGSGL